IHIGTIILVCSPEPGTLSILQAQTRDAPASRTPPTTACQSHGSIDWPCQIYNISHFILSTLLYKNSEGHIHCQRVNFCMSSGECVHTVAGYFWEMNQKQFLVGRLPLSCMHFLLPLVTSILSAIYPLLVSRGHISTDRW